MQEERLEGLPFVSSKQRLCINGYQDNEMDRSALRRRLTSQWTASGEEIHNLNCLQFLERFRLDRRKRRISWSWTEDAESV